MVQSRPPWTQTGRMAAGRRGGGVYDGVGAKRFIAAPSLSAGEPPPALTVAPVPMTTWTRGGPWLPAVPSGGRGWAEPSVGGDAGRGGVVGLPVTGST